MKFRAVVFDMDGVLADSEPVFLEGVNAVIAVAGKEMTPELHHEIMGTSVEDTWRILIDRLGLPGSMSDYVPAYDAEMRRRLAEMTEALPGARELVAELRRRGVPIAVASSSWPAWIRALLGGIGLLGSFDAIASATEVEHPKPAPDLYLLAAERLGVEPRRCVAIEDTPTGLRSAKAAGMFAVQVRAASTAFPPLPEADAVIDTLADFDLAVLSPD
jgi:HAD superfamily hydrolase (TIGR01509 family)